MRDSNPRQADYDSAALPTELTRQQEREAILHKRSAVVNRNGIFLDVGRWMLVVGCSILRHSEKVEQAFLPVSSLFISRKEQKQRWDRERRRERILTTNEREWTRMGQGRR